jgi:hypothetical protein
VKTLGTLSKTDAMNLPRSLTPFQLKNVPTNIKLLKRHNSFCSNPSDELFAGFFP